MSLLKVKPSGSRRPERPDKRAAGTDPATGSLTRMSSAQRRLRILAAARRIFTDYGLNGAKTRQIAAAAGITEATMFSYFESKEHLFRASILEPLQELGMERRQRARAYAEAGNADMRQEITRLGVRHNLTTMNDIFPLLATALFSDPERGKAFFNETIDPLLKEFAGATEQILDQNGTAGLTPRIVAAAIFGMFFGIALDRAYSGQTIAVGELSNELSQLIRNGLTRPSLADAGA